MDYFLMHKDDPVARISIEPDGIKWKENINKKLLPLVLSKVQDDEMSEKMNLWNGNRCIPAGRPNYQELLDRLNLKHSSDWITLSYMCSLTDCYWFKTTDSQVIWQDVNFHQNGFDSNLYKFLFYGDLTTAINNFYSPDIVTDGAIPKMWAQDNKAFCLIKKSNESTCRTQCNEKIASKVLDMLEIPHANYELTQEGNEVHCVSYCFINDDTEEFIPAYDVIQGLGCKDEGTRDIFVRLGLSSEFDAMLVVDFLLGNVDRHTRNFGVIVDSDTQEIKRFAPLFDHGDSYMLTDLGNLYYSIDGMKFNEMILTASDDALEISKKFDIDTFSQIIDSIPYIDEYTKEDMLTELQRRVEHIGEILIEREFEIDDREY